MSKVTHNKIKHLKMRSIWPSIVFFIISLVIGILMIELVIGTIMVYSVEKNYVEARNEVTQICENLEALMEKGYSYMEVLDNVEDSLNHPVAMSICDKDNNPIYFYGELIDFEHDAIVDEDVNIRFILDDTVSVDKNTIQFNFVQFNKGINDVYVDGGKEAFNTLSSEIYPYSYWVKQAVGDDNVYIKYNQALTLNDGLFIFGAIVASALVLLFMITFHLITAIANIVSQRQLVGLLVKDPVTGGNNFLAFTGFAIKKLSSPFTRKRGYAIVDLSLAKYQNYCTLYGTQEGERMLYALDSYIRKCLQRGEAFARVTNADYVLLLKQDMTEDRENHLVERINGILKELPDGLKKMRIYGGTVQGLNNVILKAGVYFIGPATDPENRIRRKKDNINVDQLYIKAGIAKQGLTDDAGLMVYNHEMWENELWEQTVEDKMQEALEHEEFQVYIQPKYNPVTDELVGGEALVRWISPTEGFISPGKFIPIFEKTGFVTKLDDYMISKTAKLQSDWLQEGKQIVPISVNVSRAHFAQPDLAEHIRDLVDQYPLPHKFIEIELTESAFFDDKKALLSTVSRLQEYGFEVSMDDFGSGYSSLNSLKDLPLNVLKLDAEFFRGDDFGTRGEIVVSEAISLAKQLNMRIVAEGVEKKEQVDFLAQQKCDMIQGYYYAKPMPANEYVDRMHGTNNGEQLAQGN